MNTNEFLDTVFRGTSELDRDALFLRYYSSYSYADIADILSISVEKARRRCRRGVKNVMRNVLNATPVQKVSLDDILRIHFAPKCQEELADSSFAELTQMNRSESGQMQHPDDASKNAIFKLTDYTSEQAALLARIADSYNPAYDGPERYASTG